MLSIVSMDSKPFELLPESSEDGTISKFGRLVVVDIGYNGIGFGVGGFVGLGLGLVVVSIIVGGVIGIGLKYSDLIKTMTIVNFNFSLIIFKN